jgi:hypothetical protein
MNFWAHVFSIISSLLSQSSVLVPLQTSSDLLPPLGEYALGHGVDGTATQGLSCSRRRQPPGEEQTQAARRQSWAPRLCGLSSSAILLQCMLTGKLALRQFPLHIPFSCSNSTLGPVLCVHCQTSAFLLSASTSRSKNGVG